LITPKGQGVFLKRNFQKLTSFYTLPKIENKNLFFELQFYKGVVGYYDNELQKMSTHLIKRIERLYIRSEKKTSFHSCEIGSRFFKPS